MNKTIYIDIDDTICKTNGLDYSEAKPIYKNIEIANKLYDDGNYIVYWTARGTKTGIDWRKLTEQQFNTWGVKYNELKFGKPVYDMFIDDKNINTIDWEKGDTLF
jgi:histidinol phosphatase-like enzyme